jgi:uncharacterized protein (TIGR00255 family)
MIKSMTGYGSANHEDDLIAINIETKTLNSKFLDIALKLPKQLNALEVDIKNLITKHLIRGKVSFGIEINHKTNLEKQKLINSELFNQYFSELKSLGSGKTIGDDTLFNNVLALPDVVSKTDDNDIELDKNLFLNLCQEALKNCSEFRLQEGKALENELSGSINSIAKKLEKIIIVDPVRIKMIKERIGGNIAEYVGSDKIDENRFEQELIYYIEKLDINEETSRLKNHLNYFQEVLGESESQGKKLGFISQEIGREINTIGSKANNADIQRLVVDMKDELERIKEQVLNAV